MGALVLLGLVASVFLVFSNSLQFVRIGLVAALWAAAIGALAATRFRKESSVDKAKIRDLQTVYELQLEREVTARREYELGVEARVRQEVGADATEMAALRAELSVLRQNLQRLFDGDLLVERPALHADATRIGELESRPAGPANNSSANAESWVSELNNNMTPVFSMTPVFVPDHPEPPQFATPYDEPVTAETSVVSADGDYDDEYDDRDEADPDQRGRASDTHDTDPLRRPKGWSDAFTEAEPEAADPEPSIPLRVPPRDPAPTPPPLPRLGGPTAPTPQVGTAGSRRRRRDDEDEVGTPSRKLSVAEIMANLQSENGRSDNGGRG